MKELVSVIIPFYNEEQYIGDCLISLIKQTYKNIEIICVDDGSTDKGAMIVKAIQQSDSRISLIQQENMNAGTARNVGFSKAKGEYVLFLDSDDFFSPLMVERMLNKALSTNSDIVFCTGYGLNVITKETYMMPPVGKDNASFPNKEVFSSADTTDGIFQLSVTWAWDKMYRTDFIRKNDIFFQGTKVCNDLVFVCLSYLFGERITSVNQHFICHRTNIAFGMHSVNGICISNSLTDNYLRQFKQKVDEKGIEVFLSLDECIRKEYEGNKPVIITFPDIVFTDELSIDAGNCPIRLFRSKAPHTDDSTLVFVEREKVLFLGDAAGGTFPTWDKNPELCNQLADTIDALDVDVCLESHWTPETKQEMIDDLRSI